MDLNLRLTCLAVVCGESGATVEIRALPRAAGIRAAIVARGENGEAVEHFSAEAEDAEAALEALSREVIKG